MKARNNKFAGLLIAATVSLAGILSCQSLPGPVAQSPVQQSLLNLNTESGAIRLHIDLPVPKSYRALEAYHGFSAQSIEEGRINRIKVTITHVSSDFKAEKTIPISQGGMTATIRVPLGKNYLMAVQGMDDLEEVPGALVKSVFSVESAEITPDVDVNPLSTAVATILEQVKSRDKAAAAEADAEKIKALVVEAKSAANPYLLNHKVFVDAIVAAKGKVPSIVPTNPILKPGNLIGTLNGLNPGDAAVIFCNDPVSAPVIVVAPPATAASADATATTTSNVPQVQFRIDNIPPGNWVVRVVASGYGIDGDTIADINELSPAKDVTITSNNQTSVDFDIRKADWRPTPINASGNIGSSDQPDAEMDGSDNIHMVWRQDGFQEEKESGSIFYSRYNGKTWSTDNRNISTQPSGFVSVTGDDKFRGARHPAVAVGVDRSPHVVWSATSNSVDFKGRRIAYSHFDGVNWSKPLIISGTSPASEVEADHPDIAINPINGQVYAVWNQLLNGVKTVYLSQLQNDKWLEPVQLSAANTQSWHPRINIGTNGVIHVLWEVEDTSRVQYIAWDGKQFQAIEDVPFNKAVNGNVSRNIDARIDLLNRLHVIQRSQNSIQYLFRSNNSWSRSEPAHEMGNFTLPVLSDASLYLDNIGNVNLVWTSSLNNGTPILRYRRRTNEGWETPVGFNTTVSPTPTPTAFATPTPDPTATARPLSSATPTPSPFQGFDDLPGSNNKVTADKPLVLVDGRGRINTIWSNSESDPVNSEIYHALKVTEKLTN